MYRVDIQKKQLIEIPETSFDALGLRERFDIQEWINSTPEILGEPLLIIAKELRLPSGSRLDLLAVDKEASLVVIEFKRDDSGRDVEWQAVKYASYCSSFSTDDIYQYFAEYMRKDRDDAQAKIEQFIDCEPEELNQKQRIILVAREFHSDVASAVLWLREHEIDIECIRLIPHRDQSGNLFIDPEIIIPLPEARDYLQKKESKQKERQRSGRSSFSLEKSNLRPEELRARIIETLRRPSDLTPRIRKFLEIITRENRPYDREEVKKGLHEAKIGDDIGKAGQYLSNISQFLTKKSNPHLRQAIEFESDGEMGDRKYGYHVIPEYRELILEALRQTEESGGEGSR